MARRLLDILALLMLSLVIAVVALWVRSYWTADCLFFWNARGEWSAETRAGYLSIETSNIHGGDVGACRLVTAGVAPVAFARQMMRTRAVRSFAGFVYGRDIRPGSGVGLMPDLERRGLKTPTGTLTREFWYVPMWFVFIVVATPTYLLLRPRYTLWRRRRRGLCLGCGYDLTGNVSGVCPECGRSYGG